MSHKYSKHSYQDQLKFRDILNSVLRRGKKVDFVKVEVNGEKQEVFESHPNSTGDYFVEFNKPFPTANYKIEVKNV